MAPLLSSNGKSKIPPVLLVLSLLALALAVESAKTPLTKDYYKKTCPRFNDIVTQVVTNKQTSAPTTAAAVVRVFFHDCMVGGCDASTLVASNSFHGKTERDADINLSLPGDAFDLVTRVKTAVELECPGVVSCTDILAVSARNLVTMTGGPFYEILLGRKDGLTSKVFIYTSLKMMGILLASIAVQIAERKCGVEVSIQMRIKWGVAF